MADDHGKNVMGLAKDLAGARGMLASDEVAASSHAGDDKPDHVAASGSRVAARWPESIWTKGYLFSMALTIGGGTAEVQRNIIAERVLGLPHELDLDGAKSFDSIKRP
jgi:alkylation response protein AidB-like acyl-CoA dehydrogenase